MENGPDTAAQGRNNIRRKSASGCVSLPHDADIGFPLRNGRMRSCCLFGAGALTRQIQPHPMQKRDGESPTPETRSRP